MQKTDTDTDTDTGTLSRIAPGKRYTLRVNWPGFKGLKKLFHAIIQAAILKLAIWIMGHNILVINANYDIKMATTWDMHSPMSPMI